MDTLIGLILLGSRAVYPYGLAAHRAGEEGGADRRGPRVISMIVNSSSGRKRSAVSTNMRWVRWMRSGPTFAFVESDIAGLPPGKYVEETTELPAIGDAQTLEYLRRPDRRARLG